MNNRNADVVIIGGGIMGLLSAYRLRQLGREVVIIDNGEIGGLQAASSGITRSIRNDYEDPIMAAMAYDAFRDWPALEQDLGGKFREVCGCLNFINSEMTEIAAEDSYAGNAATWLERDGRDYRVFSNKEEFMSRYPQLVGDYGVLDTEAGIAMPQRAVAKLLEALQPDPKVKILENTTVTLVKPTESGVTVRSAAGEITAKKLIVTAGCGTAEVCRKIEGVATNMTITPDRPFELKYFFTEDEAYSSKKLPVFAFLDLGIYVHPVFESLTPGVKIGYYSPPGLELNVDDSISFIDNFVDKCLPGLRRDDNNRLITEVDQCSYDMTPDNKFILGYLDDSKNIIVAGGFNGTGFKFAPTITSIAARLAEGEAPGYDLSQFDPGRFNAKEPR
jgi:glycine/D-amino acid oxidase-like deaminating enzyme